jgi:hypothetical protein
MVYGSFQNHIFGNGKNEVVPQIGMGATQILWTDRHAYTIVEISPSGKKIIVQRDKAHNTGGHGSNDWTYERDENGIKCAVTLRKNGKWIAKGESLKHGSRFILNWRNENYDWEF